LFIDLWKANVGGSTDILSKHSPEKIVRNITEDEITKFLKNFPQFAIREVAQNPIKFDKD